VKRTSMTAGAVEDMSRMRSFCKFAAATGSNHPRVRSARPVDGSHASNTPANLGGSKQLIKKDFLVDATPKGTG
jgi:hypothetical protein